MVELIQQMWIINQKKVLSCTYLYKIICSCKRRQLFVTCCFVLLSDINECSYSHGGCAQLCVNFPGGYNCSCLQGYTLQSDKKSCQGTCTSVEYAVFIKTRDEVAKNFFTTLIDYHHASQQLLQNIWTVQKWWECMRVAESCWENMTV